DACRASSFDELFERYISRIEGWLSKPEARFLFRCAKRTTGGCVVEVGSYRGRSTAALGFGVNTAGAGVPVFAIDPHEPFEGVFGGEFGPDDRGAFMRAMAATGLYRHVRLVNLSSERVTDHWTLPVSLLFLDGDHRYAAVRRDFEAWAPKLAAEALVVLDDVDRGDGPVRLARELVETGAFEVEADVGKMTCLRCIGQPRT
ncbi:MAG TPA: class I SAM-dependent methyltransferase, partial [Caulobacteraceae bacterium]|nr:class I SAM-dependent methyltransferase [Caulobacteraceae bacterium]